ncbi:MAG: hypothetical protein KatS3mg028_1391 [Bacteroidia bacterium]|nr:MAG: hypothetical protein KatS3mg028_1391 [Bacteroidia bacterium]
MVTFARKLVSSVRAVNKDIILGYGLLLSSIVIGILNLQVGVFIDEEDNLLMGSLILRGFLPYRDIFSHHFPFAYYWTSMVYSITSESIYFARLSVVIFQLLIFFLSIRLSSNFIVFGVVSLIWNLIRPYYWGNMILYHSLLAPLSVSIFLITYFILTSDVVPNLKHAVFLALLFSISFLLTPLAIYILFFSSMFIFIKNKKLFFQIVITLSTAIFIFLIYLFFTNSLVDFFDQAILFNLNVYSKYNLFYKAQTEGGLLAVIQSIYQFLDIGQKEWYNFDLFKPLVFDYSDIDRWIFTGFHYRIAWIILFLYSILNRKFLAATFSILFGASLLSIGKIGFHGQPFVVTSLSVSALSIFLIFNKSSNYSKKNLTFWVFGLLLLIFWGWLGFRLIESIKDLNSSRTYREQYKVHVEISNRIKKWTCESDDVRLIYYPAGYRQHFFTRLLPLTKYTAMYPWIAEVGQDEVIKALQKNDLVIVYLEPIDVWGIELQDYLSPMIEYLRREYKPIDDWVFVSPLLYSVCPISIPENTLTSN